MSKTQLKFKVTGQSTVVINQEVYYTNREYIINCNSINEKEILKEIINNQNDYYKDQKIDAKIEITG